MNGRIIIDTNILVAALQSTQGASYHLIQYLEQSPIQACITVPLFCEYEEVLNRFVSAGKITKRSQELILNYMCAHAIPIDVHYLWRPFLNDADDEMVLEAAIAASAKWIVTHNLKDFSKTHELGIRAITPGDYLKIMELLP